jgi:hypothetical protein
VAFILTVASVLAWVDRVTTNYAYPVTSRKVIATYLCRHLPADPRRAATSF